jgi:hypothetical protein
MNTRGVGDIPRWGAMNLYVAEALFFIKTDKPEAPIARKGDTSRAEETATEATGSVNPRVTSAIGMGLGFLGVLAWVWLVPYSAPTAEAWGTALVLLRLAALVLVITISSAVLVNSYWVRFTPALRWFRLVSVIGVIVGPVGILAWLSWVFTPPCMSSEPIAPGVCPPVPGAAEEWGALVVLILLINLSAFVLVKSFRRRGPSGFNRVNPA